ncbi:Mu-like prophage major head subunit gpT family protein [Ancylobacter defluvii]|uniref:Head protein n=1 Tax=Ancylobacter defluvii TaxID=1282440 RepID=A0A9W6NCJ9_9HYPH|nr:Mu-like prophage major head subunit gpT family protein [Ancylobacter defluvii]MBS7586411.1 Mu-like prophage major head subunit gpT family protein [Ancylobacter defluvii]GLK85692.1 head protein [Ancylobacter defluvii]
MIINRANLSNLYVGFNAAFQRGLGQAAPMWERIATRVTSTTKTEEYGWIGKIPNMREWIGDRQVQNLSNSGYSVTNKDFELTIGVDRNDIEDDTLGIYSPLFEEMGRSSGANYDQLSWALLKAGFATPCYDKQYFFDTDHPVLDENGKVISVANTDGGAGTPWFLVDNSRALKPLLLQVRKNIQLVRKDREDDDNVFERKQFLYGVDGRHNVGFGFWQFAWGSKQTLNAANYAIARAGLSGMKGDYGRPLGLMPKLLIVPPALESAGRKLLNSENAAGGETNEWKGTAELLVVPWLA